MRFRGKSIRRKIVALLLVPLVSLTALWGFATVLTGREAGQLLDVAYVVEKVGYPVEDVVRVIQKERRQTLVYLGDPRTADALSALNSRRAATDKAVADMKANAQDPDVSEEMRPDVGRRLASILEAFDGITSLRMSVDKSVVDREQALELYNRLIDPCYAFLMNLHALENVEMDKQGRALVGITRAREVLSREDAVLASALAAKRFTDQDVRLISDLVANRTLLYEFNLAILPADDREVFEQYWRSPETKPLREAEESVIAAGATKKPRAVGLERWEAAADPVLDDLAEMGTAAGDRYQNRVEPVAVNVLVKAGIAGVLGFVALVVSLILSVRIGRDLIRDLSRLRKDAHEVSGVRLPSVMRRLAAGEHVDVETEAPRLEFEKDEVGQVGQALNTLQRAAVEAAVKQADMRRGVSEVFVNLARRNQVLLHRQLTLLDTMERRTEDTDELADLFRLDHLTTRMRRHAEGLVILSGAAPSRQWRKPVQLMDVVRAAVAEVEDYERIEVRRLPRLGVGGPAVADLTHLIAELLENATVFSPPHTAVQVHGERVANGFTLEIHDRGLGMAADALLDANLRLAETPEFELSDTDRLGLFVVSRLAQRQNVRVSLQPSPYGGTTAVVFIPAALLTDAPETEGIGFRLDRTSSASAAAGARRNGTAARLAGLTEVRAGGITGPAGVLDGPVELEAPLGDLGDLGDLEDTESERGGIFRARGRGSGPAGEQHQHASDSGTGGGLSDPESTRAGAAVPLPRRRPPTLVAEHGRRVARRPVAAVAPDHGAPEPVAPEPAAPVREAGGLPRRVRQASLAPQLKAGPAPRTGQDGDEAASDADRDADEVRSRMASLQRGWQRGRQHNAEGDTSRGETAQRTTSERDGR
ncbi:nitrate- and nitrite sensing domain-containing protein [Streptomyces sp. A3M-1-3]|uniref:sensor histidine kinase n=1 Tax=Streptomyces sp. A3M-1-3 TaxID=2962044 RepID=UPI0020B7D6BD|nr:nitrate- and nitrite sensing domain-containing protein [Streptomyces sp. A3M-1-3]MCP3816960.1 nitrate- and nitrite sensing domain-containing protein [Streptomyces sp. A3M-1-3]